MSRVIEDESAELAINDAIASVGVTGYERATPLYCAARSAVRLIGTIFQNLKVYNVTNVPLSGGVLLLSNHQSFVDPAFIASKLPRKLSFLARASLFDPIGFGWLIRQLNAFPVKQGKGDVGAMKQSIALLQQGKALLMFPEGQRTEDGKMQEIAPGAALIVKRAKVPIVPVAIQGAFDVWPKHRMFPRTGKVRINFGAPVILHNLDSRAIIPEIERHIHDLLNDLHAIEEAERAPGLIGPLS
jgi:1-acyl-sn-glycerol-3-phosphate acyltransferase